MTGVDVALGAMLLAAVPGAARISLFFVNRLVFGRKHERPLLKYLVITTAILILMLPFAAASAFHALEREDWTLLSAAAGIVLAIFALVGAYWVVHRIFVNRSRRSPVEGTRSRSAEVFQLRRAHVPYEWLRNLGAHNEVYDLEVTEHDVIVADLPASLEGLTIGFMSDTHVAGFLRRDFIETGARALSSRNPDVILLGGDYVTWHRHIPLLGTRLLPHLRAKLGVFAVLGNHDYWSVAPDVVAELERNGVRVITNERVTLERNGAKFDVVGVDELYRGEPDLSLLRKRENNPTILLSHHPDLIAETGETRFDLFLCGHTHGGQIRFPGLGAVVVPSKFEAKYDQGFFRERNTLMYVGRGLGSVPPLRILCKPEIAIFRFTAR